ncbi:nucleoside deaminase [Pseudorhodoplanes sp.]|jgi:tRNA(adenine34) deaminase|uniref:nucleoside deaminase n=1 Tax=Pseudorhodoplanes sp. TaxID=1934341 RepID=UPI002D7FFAAF|nr:nucleoside deaminase [Pseudorhodoplanes sp.]
MRSKAPCCIASRDGCFHPTRRFVIAGLGATALGAGRAFAADKAPPSAADERFMRMALEEARRADFPFGAVIVRDGKVIARGGNRGRALHDPTAHGEMVAIRNAVRSPGAEALRGAVLYTTGEPCAMCMGAIIWCHIGRVVFAASIDQLATLMDQIMVTSADLAARAKFAPVEITGGVLADEAMALFRARVKKPPA